jgi:hypothetical protein
MKYLQNIFTHSLKYSAPRALFPSTASIRANKKDTGRHIAMPGPVSVVLTG